MTISSTSNKAQFNGSGTTGPFSFTFKTFAAGDLTVIKTDSLGVETTLALTTDYTVSLNADQNNNPGGSVATVATVASGSKLTILRVVDALQETDIANGGGFYPEVIENSLDRLTMLVQQVDEKAERGLTVPASTSGVSTELPTPTPGGIIAFNDAADALTTVPPSNLGNFAWSATSYADRFSGNGSQTAFTLTAAPGGENATQVYISGVYQQKNTYSLSGDTITFSVAPPSGTNNIEVVSAVVPTDFQQLVTDAQTAATTATTQAGTATTQAGTATTQAGIATTQAGIATTQAGIATTAANNAAASYDAFDDRYLGSKAADPTLDNDGNALLTGALYWNSVSNLMRVYTGSAWSDIAVGVSTPYQSFSGTGAQTAFTLSGTPGSLGSLEVYISGVRQVPTADYTVSGTTLTFTSAPPSGTNNVFARWITTQAINVPADGSVTFAKLDAGAVASQAEAEAGAASNKIMTPQRVAQAIAAIASTSDQVARDQIALTNIRLMLNSAITTGALVQGRQWELSTDEWGSSSTNETYASSTPNYYNNPTSTTPVASGTGTASQNFDTNTGAWTDGTTNQSSSAASTRGSAATAYGQKAWSGTKQISAVRVYRPNDTGYDGTAGGATITVTVEGSATGAFSGEQVTLGSNTATDYDGARGGADAASPTSGYDYIPVTVTNTAYAYHRVTVSTSAGASGVRVAEIQFSEFVAAANMTLIPPAAASVSTAPSYMVAYFLWKDDSGSAVLGTDLTVELSRDNGTTYTTATLTNLASYDGTYSIIKARANVSSQPSGTSMLCRIKTLNSKAQRMAAPALYAE